MENDLQGQNDVDQPVEDLARSLFGDDAEDLEPVTPVEPAVVEPVVEPVVPAVSEPATVAEPAVPVQQVPQVTPEQIAQFQQWQQQQQQQQQQQPPPASVQHQSAPAAPISEEEVARLTNRFVLDERGYDAIFATENKAESIAALNQVLQGTVRQAVTMAYHLIQDATGNVRQQVQPYMQFADTQRALMLKENFFAKNPDLVGSDVVINAVMTQMQQSGQRYDDPDKLFDAVAKATKAQLAQLGQRGQQVAPGTPVVKPRMASLPAGAQGGSRMAPTGSGVSNTAKNLFG